ncbi:hypothetical protein Btru_056904 [Bulinus truncatus]|nr:hypothetical protein Btru_056904 [Bulinus truncatus]
MTPFCLLAYFILSQCTCIKLAEKVAKLREIIPKVEEESDTVSSRLSLHDRNLIEGKIRDVESSLNKLEARIQRKFTGYKTIQGDLDAIKEEAEKYLLWLEQQEVTTNIEQLDGHSVEDVQKRISTLKALATLLNEKQVSLQDVRQKAHVLVADLPTPEKDALEKLMCAMQTKHNEIYSSLTEKFQVLEDMTNLRMEFTEKVERESKLLQERENELKSLNIYALPSTQSEKNLDKCKSLHAKVKAQLRNMVEIKSNAENLMENMTDHAREHLKSVVHEISGRHEDLLKRLSEKEIGIQTFLLSSKKFEGNCLKMELWFKESSRHFEEILPWTLTLEVIEEKLQVIKGLSVMVPTYEVLLREITEFKQSSFLLLSESDQLNLQQQIDFITSTFHSICAQIAAQEKKLNDSLSEQTEVQKKVSQSEEFIQSIESEFKNLSLSSGPHQDNSQALLYSHEALKQKLVDCEPYITELFYLEGKFQHLGEWYQKDNILRVLESYKSVLHRITHGIEMCKKAVELREEFEQHLSQQNSSLAECEALVTESQSLSKYENMKLISEKLDITDSELSKALERAKIIEQDVPDVTPFTERVQDLNQRCKKLRENVHSYQQLMESAEVGRKQFETAVDTVVAWFEDREDWIASCTSVPLDEAQVSAVIDKHKLTSLEATAKLKEVKCLADNQVKHCQQLALPVPPEITTKLKQIDQLEELTMAAVLKKESYLDEAHSKRKQFETCARNASDWLSQASELLDSGYDGLDYDTLEETYSDLADFFSDASQVEDTLSQINELAKDLLPTLDTNDSITLKEMLKNSKKKYNNVLLTSQTKISVMKSKSEQWRQLQESACELSNKLDALEADWLEINKCSDASPDSVQTHLDKAKACKIN